MDQPLYATQSRSELSDQGITVYQSFDSAVVLDQIIRQAGDDPGQRQFRSLLLRLRDGDTTVDDWKILMSRTPTRVSNLTSESNFAESNFRLCVNRNFDTIFDPVLPEPNRIFRLLNLSIVNGDNGDVTSVSLAKCEFLPREV